mgnify:FL=1
MRNNVSLFKRAPNKHYAMANNHEHNRKAQNIRFINHNHNEIYIFILDI